MLRLATPSNVLIRRVKGESLSIAGDYSPLRNLP